METDEAIPGIEASLAADWLSKLDPQLSAVAANGETCLFWYIVGLLAAYKEKVKRG